ncbi:hypothetical protein [Acinetobacter thermotolerans]|uniref:hypothetical protein n=1 Tax=Acinetobacter thermotolerans TaxID=3151487 RepID=UPI00325C3012
MTLNRVCYALVTLIVCGCHNSDDHNTPVFEPVADPSEQSTPVTPPAEKPPETNSPQE